MRRDHADCKASGLAAQTEEEQKKIDQTSSLNHQVNSNLTIKTQNLSLQSQSPNMHFSAFTTLLVASSATIFANPLEKRTNQKANEYASRFTFETVLWHSELINVRFRSGLVSEKHSEKIPKDLALRYPTDSVLST